MTKKPIKTITIALIVAMVLLFFTKTIIGGLLTLIYFSGILFSTYFSLWTVDKRYKYNKTIRGIDDIEEKEKYTEIKGNNVFQIIMVVFNLFVSPKMVLISFIFYNINNIKSKMDVVDFKDKYTKRNYAFVNWSILLIIYVISVEVTMFILPAHVNPFNM